MWRPGTRRHDTTILDAESGATESASVPFNFKNGPISIQRQSLPINVHRRQLLYAIEKYPVLVVVGETGSGKSTQITQYLYENGWCDDGFSVVCTQPRRIAAQTLAQRVSKEVGCALGDTVGYTVRFDDVTSPTTAIRYVTDGTLLREATLSDPLLSRYSVIMIDEAHERNLNTDALLGIVKKIRRKRKNLRVIVCSATIDAEAFLDFFVPKKVRDKNMDTVGGTRKRKSIWGKEDEKSSHSHGETETKSENIVENGVIISIDGRQHPVDMLYAKETIADYVEGTVDTALRIHFDISQDDGDILCFLPTGEDIDRAIAIAEENYRMHEEESASSSSSPSRKAAFLPLYGNLPYQMQAKIFRPKVGTDTSRRIIFATNIAETSVTVPDITSVIDCGFAKLPYFDPETGFDRLIVSPISQASAKQRAGRAGRIKPGKCYRLYKENALLNTMPSNTPPEILRSNLSPFILTLKALGIHNILAFDLMSVPSVPALCQGLESLFALGAIDDTTKLTKLGDQMAEFPTEPRVARMMLESISLGCSREILCISAALQVRSLFYQPRTQKQQMDYDAVMNDMMDFSGDHITYVNLMQLNDDTPLTEEDCKERFVNYLALRRAGEVRSQLRRFLKRYGRIVGMDESVTSEQKSATIRKCVTAGFFANTAKLGNDGNYYSLRGKHMISISTGSALHKYGIGSEYIVFGETYDGSKGGIEVRSCSSIEARWLRDLAPHYWA